MLTEEQPEGLRFPLQAFLKINFYDQKGNESDFQNRISELISFIPSLNYTKNLEYQLNSTKLILINVVESTKLAKRAGLANK